MNFIDLGTMWTKCCSDLCPTTRIFPEFILLAEAEGLREMPSITGAHEAGRHNFQQRLALWLAAEAPQRRGCLCRIAPVALRRKLNSDKVCGWNAVNSLRRVVMLEQNVLLGRKCVPHSLLFRKCLQVGYGEGQLIVCNELLKHTLCVVNILMQHLPQASHGMLSAEWGLPGEVCTVPRRVSTQAVRIRFRLTFLHFTGKNPLQAWGLKILIELSLWVCGVGETTNMSQPLLFGFPFKYNCLAV